MPAAVEFQCSRHFLAWLYEARVSLAFTTYQTNRLFLIGLKEDGRLSAFERHFEHPMGLWTDGERMLMGTRWQIWELADALPQGEQYRGYDRVYVPRHAHTTGHVDSHDVVLDAEQRIVFVNTLYSCLAEISERYSFKPIWKPSFISKLAPEDRCHLNGLALADGRAAYVTAVSRSDAVAGWRDRRHSGGCVIDVEDDEIVLGNLSMPHSPRIYGDRLWLLNSGTGELGWVDQRAGHFEPVAFCPGYLRGLAFHGHYAIVGLSKPRRERAFSGLELDERLRQKDTEARCGLWVIDLASGDVAHWMQIEGVVVELYDVAVLPATRQPMAVGFKTDEIERLITIEHNHGPVFSALATGEAQAPQSSHPEPAPMARKRTATPQVEALYRLGNEQAAAGNYQEAIAHYEQVLRLDPGHVGAWTNLGTTRWRLGEADAASRCWEQAVQLDPRAARALVNLAILRRQAGELDEAAQLLDRARAAAPNNREVLREAVSLYALHGREADACQAAEALTRLEPGSARAHHDHGALLMNQQNGPAALACFERAVQLDPQLGESWINIAVIREGLGDPERARQAWPRALELCKAPFRALRAALVAPVIWTSAEELDGYRAHVERTLDAFVGRDLQLPLSEIQASGAEAPFPWAYHGRDNAALKRKYAKVFSSLFADLPRHSHGVGRPPWRIGFVVTQTHEGVFLRCMAELIDQLDRRRFRPAVVCPQQAFEEMRQHLHNSELDLVALPRHFDEAVASLRAASFAALYFWEVGTDAFNYFLPFCRMAPLQVTGWGWPETSGAPHLDFHLTSAVLAPTAADSCFTESLWRLPSLPACPRQPPCTAKPLPVERFGLPKGTRLYLCAQNLRKVHFDMDPLLAGILEADPKATLAFFDDASPLLGQRLRQRWQTTLGAQGDRIVLLPRLSPDNYMAILASAHVVLDTPHFSGSNTAYDTLIAGVPVVTLPGDQPRSRYTAGLYAEVTGTTELVAASPEQYVEIAVRVATDPSLRRNLSERLRAAVPVAFENPAAARGLEEFFATRLDELRG